MVGFVYGLLVFCFSMFWLFSEGRRLAFKVSKSGCFGRCAGLGRDGVELFAHPVSRQRFSPRCACLGLRCFSLLAVGGLFCWGLKLGHA
jgi:hypothetical protein